MLVLYEVNSFLILKSLETEKGYSFHVNYLKEHLTEEIEPHPE